MARNTSIVLGDHFAKFVDGKVAGGRYASASEVVRAGLRLLEEHDTRLEALRASLTSGMPSGALTASDFDGAIASGASGNTGSVVVTTAGRCYGPRVWDYDA